MSRAGQGAAHGNGVIAAGRAQDLEFGYSTFSKGKKKIGRQCALRSFQSRRPLASHRRQSSPAVPLEFAAANRKWKKRGYAGRRIGIGMDRELGTCSRCQLGVAVGLRGGEVGHLSPRGNMRLESLFCDVRSSPRYTLKTILITNLVFLVENLSPKVL